jgi:hypothetical protein
MAISWLMVEFTTEHDKESVPLNTLLNVTFRSLEAMLLE